MSAENRRSEKEGKASPAESAHEKCDEIEELVKRWQGGDRSAGNLLFSRYYSQLMVYAHRMFPAPLHRRADTCDVVQEACAAACKSCVQFEYRDTSSFAKWLFAIVQQKLWKRWRAERAQMRDIAKVRRLGTDMVIPEAQQTPSENLSLREDVKELETAVNRLPPEYRRVEAARYLENKSWSEIAAGLGKSREASRMLLLRALRKLGGYLGK